MRKIVIFEHDGGELANQLWNWASICAYALERGAACENWSLFEYARFFNTPAPCSLAVQPFFWLFSVGRIRRRSSFRSRTARRAYKLLIAFPTRMLHRGAAVYSSDAPEHIYYLPPERPASPGLARKEERLETLYFGNVSGGVFRNPAGMRAHRAALLHALAPREKISRAAQALVAPLREGGKKVIGVHLRQGDYKTFKEGRFFLTQERVRAILDEYLRENGLAPEGARFLIASDGPIDRTCFDSLEVRVSRESAVVDLFALASCDAVIGSHSTFGNFAAWWGDVPHIIMQREPIDWPYYADKRGYFENKYFQTVIR